MTMRVQRFATGPERPQRAPPPAGVPDILAIDAWVATAQPGARVIYGTGTDVHSGSAEDVPHRLRKLYEAGLVRLHVMRRAGQQGVFDYLAVRCGKPVPKGYPKLPVPKVHYVDKVGGR
jgi:hypothetical protein